MSQPNTRKSAYPWDLEATDLSRMIRSGDLSPSDAVRGCLERCDAFNDQVHAFTHIDAEGALRQAEKLEQRMSAGEQVGPLAGVPIAIKDLISVAGMPMTGGSALYPDFVPDEDDVTVERLREADAIIIGKTAVSEFGYSALAQNPIDPPVRNPWNLDLTTGGSSAGSGAAVALGITSVALGSDGGGSVRIPASACGLVGFKSSMGRVPLYPGCRDERYPGFSSWESLEHIGPLTRTVRDTALMMSVIAGPDPRDRRSIPDADVDWQAALGQGVRNPRIALCLDFGYHSVDPEVIEAVERQAKLIERELGATIEYIDPRFPDPSDTFWALIGLDTDLEAMRRHVDELGDALGPEVRSVARTDWRAEDFTNAVRDRKAVVNRMWKLMQQYDYILTPTLAVPPFAAEATGPTVIDGKPVRDTSWSSFNVPFNLTGQPSISLPAGHARSGAPIGLQVAGKHLADAAVLGFAAAYETVFDWKSSWPRLAYQNDGKAEAG